MENKLVDKLNGIWQFLKDVKIELTKVTWSTRQELKESTIIVLISIVVLGFVIGVFDFAMSKFVDYVIHF